MEKIMFFNRVNGKCQLMVAEFERVDVTKLGKRPISAISG